MKKRICFVGFAEDQPAALKSLQEAMSAIDGTWDCAFAPNGPKALAAMAAESFDAVVTNMHLPGMNGAELLQQVGTLHPKTLRFVLGNVADQELIINCIGGTHHFIAQPCKPQALISTIQRGIALDAWLSTDQLRALVPRFRRLPTLPLTYFEVLKQVDSPVASVQSIGEVIARDPAATARLLQMVNSAAFALDQKVTDPVHAVSLLGLETVKSLVLCLQVFSPNDAAKKAGLSFDHLWDHSFSVATIAREIATREMGDARMANDAFTAGLLHDVGRIVLASNLPKEYAEVVAAARQNSRLLNTEEATQLGVTHAQAGAYLLGLWGMPAPLVEAAALHHTPSHTFTREFSLLTVVHVANVFAYEKDSCSEGFVPPELDLAYLEVLGLADRAAAWRQALAIAQPAPAEPTAAPAQLKPVATPAKAGLTLSTPVPVPSKPAPAPAAAPATAAFGKNKWLGRLLAPTAAVVAIAGILWLNRSNSDGDIRARARTAAESGKAPAPKVSAAPAPAKSPVQDAKLLAANTNADSKPVVAAAMDGFNSVKVQAIFYRPSNPNVMINGKTLGVGERLNGVQVISISQTNVVLGIGGERKAFQVKSK